MSLLAADPLNCEIIALSLGIQRGIYRTEGPEGPEVGAQQVMPKPEHAGDFGPGKPLPWVPDQVGTGFSKANHGVLVVGSSYNGFIEGYCQRSLALKDYLAIRNLILEGNEDPTHPKVAAACSLFTSAFERQIMAPDTSTYYGPILDLLMGKDGSRVCLTDLCKASFVRRGSGSGVSNRGDEGNDGIIKQTKNWPVWTQLLTCGRGEKGTPSPYRWIWQRMQQCRHIIALGTIAEYGVMKIFQHMAALPRVTTRKGVEIHLNRSLTSNASWRYCYTDSSRQLSHWVAAHDWWILTDAVTGTAWNMLPVYHPAARPPHSDPGYGGSAAILQEMLAYSGAGRDSERAWPV
jgi:hypothetical protein